MTDADRADADRPADGPQRVLDTEASGSKPVLSVHNLRIGIGAAAVVDGVSLTVERGELLAIVGESGCGKSIAALAIADLLPRAARRLAGEIRLDGLNLGSLAPKEMRQVRGRDLAMIFQEPVASLNPLMKIGRQVMERLIVHERLDVGEARKRALAMLERVDISRPELRLEQFPFELSGGMCQRVMIAMSLISKPKLLIADEPTTALDVTIQARILALLLDLRSRIGTAMLFITHDMGVVAQIADRVCVMYAGRIVEQGRVADIFSSPRHPYTRLLLATVPSMSGARKTRLRTIDGNVPALHEWPSGCRFRTRCPLATEKCKTLPPMLEMPQSRHGAACWHSDRVVALA